MKIPPLLSGTKATTAGVAFVLAFLVLPWPLVQGGPLPSPPAPGEGAPLHLPPSTGAGTPLVPAIPDDVPVSLSIAAAATATAPSFWGTTISAEARMMPSERAIVNATPSRILVWPGANAGDRMNLLNDTLITVNGTNLTWAPPSTNETQFIDLCRRIACTPVLQVPGEIDDPALAAQVVNYTEKTLGFHPAYWEIGNEPELWRQWQVPWDQWNRPLQNRSAMITPTQYAWEVHNYTLALRTADPAIQVLGIAGTGRAQNRYPLSDWINATVAIDGPQMAGIAFHVYTAGTYGAPTLAQFYAFDHGPYSVEGRVQTARQTIAAEVNATCPGCPDPPVFLTELGSALSHYQFGNLSLGFAGGLSMAASEVEGLGLGLSNLDVFATELNTSNSWFSLQGVPRPDYTDYAQFLSRLGPQVFPAQLVTPPGPPYTGSNTSLAANLYAIASETSTSGGRSDLLLLNQNASTNVTFTPALPGVPSGTPVMLREWSGQAYYTAANGTYWVEPRTPAPVTTVLPGGLPASFVLPAQTIALFEAFPPTAQGVDFQARGIANGTRWFLGIDQQVVESTTSNLTVLLPPGTHALSAEPLPYPLGTFYPRPRARLEPFPPATLSVGTAPLVVPVPFVLQWAFTTMVLPPGRGTVAPAFGWANTSQPFVLAGQPAPGWVVGNWTGHGHGSYTGTAPNATLLPQSGIEENVTFVAGFPVTFQESGLAPGTRWSVALLGVLHASPASSIPFLAPNGTYGFAVTPVPGYAVLSALPTFSVNGAPLTVPVTFQRVAPTYIVTWEAHGLPAGIPWFVLVGGQRWDAQSSTLATPLPNGSYPYWVGNAGGEMPAVRNGTVAVSSQPQTVTVLFEPFAYLITFTASGLPAGTSWTLVFSTTAVTLSSPSLQLLEPNGSYAWSVLPPSGYSASPGGGNLSVRGADAALAIAFAPGGPPSPSTGSGPMDVLYASLGFVVSFLLLGLAFLAWSMARRRTRPPGGPPGAPEGRRPPRGP